MDKKKKTALVTGASGGIGLEFARQLAGLDYDVILCSRNEKKLQQVKADLENRYKTTAYVMAHDLSRQEEAEALYGDCEKNGIVPDVLVNNAGAGKFIECIHYPVAEANALLSLNILSLTTLCILFGRQMADRGKGYILNVGSINAKVAVPFFACYAASKSYVLHYSIALKYELRSRGVVVSCLLPGFVRTGFEKNAQIANEQYKAMTYKNGMDAGKVAAIGLKALFKGKTVVTAGLQNKLTSLVTGLLPKGLTAGLMRIYLAEKLG